MKVLIISAAFPPTRAGEADHTLYLSQHLAARGLDIHVLTTKKSVLTGEFPFTVHPIMENWTWSALPHLGRFVKRCSPQAILLMYSGWIYNDHPMITFVPTFVKMLLPGVAFVTQFEIESISRRFSLPSRAMLKATRHVAGSKNTDYFEFGTLLRHSDRLIVLSQRHQAKFSAQFPRTSVKSIVIPPPPTIRLCSESNGAARQRGRQALGAQPDDFLLAYFGYIYANKGVETLLRAFHIVSNQRKKVRLVMIGGSTGPANNLTYAQEIYALSQTLGIADKMIWTGEYASDSDEASMYLHAVDACVFPFNAGVTLNRSSLGAAATHGLPLVTTQGTSVEAPFIHQKNVLLCPPRIRERSLSLLTRSSVTPNCVNDSRGEHSHWRMNGFPGTRLSRVRSQPSREKMMPRQPNLRIILYDPSGRGGITQYTYQLAESLACQGSSVTVITTDDYELMHLKRSFDLYIPFTKSWLKSFLKTLLSPLQKRSVSHRKNPGTSNVHSALNSKKNTTNSLFKICRLWLIWVRIIFFVLRKRPQVIHFQWLMDKKSDFYFMKILKILRFAIVYTAHDLLPHDSNLQDYQKIFRKIYSLSDKIIVHSENSKRDIVRIFGIYPKKVCVIPHGSYDLLYTDKSITKDIARKEIGIPEGKRVILFFGSIRKYKGLEYLVSAFQNIKKELEDIMLLVVGNIYNGDNEGFKFYSDLINLISHDDDIICVNGYVPFEKINSYFIASDLVVLPYIKTYTSGVLLAAYAAGRPVIVTDTGALSEVVDIGKSGFIVTPKDVNALMQAIRKVISNPDRIEQMGNYAKYLAETVYSWNNIALKTRYVYQSLNEPAYHGANTEQ